MTTCVGLEGRSRLLGVGAGCVNIESIFSSPPGASDSDYYNTYVLVDSRLGIIGPCRELLYHKCDPECANRLAKSLEAIIVSDATGMLPMDLGLERPIKPLGSQVQSDVRGFGF
jgi:hypothetical protein